MYEKLSLEGKIRFAEMKIASAQKSCDYWERLEGEYKQKYGPDPKWYECKHIRAIKQYKKQAFSDCAYWENQLQNLKAA
jgi:hypothetical protein